MNINKVLELSGFAPGSIAINKYSVEINAGGPGSGRHPYGRKVKDIGRQEKAKATYVPHTKAKQQQAVANEHALAKAVGGASHIADNQPFDVMIKSKRIAFEVKTKIDGKKDSITMHPKSLGRKYKAIKTMKLKAVYTVVFDDRPGQNKVYIAKGIGSFRLKLRDGSKNPKLIELKDIRSIKNHI